MCVLLRVDHHSAYDRKKPSSVGPRSGPTAKMYQYISRLRPQWKLHIWLSFNISSFLSDFYLRLRIDFLCYLPKKLSLRRLHLVILSCPRSFFLSLFLPSVVPFLRYFHISFFLPFFLTVFLLFFLLRVSRFMIFVSHTLGFLLSVDCTACAPIRLRIAFLYSLRNSLYKGCINWLRISDACKYPNSVDPTKHKHLNLRCVSYSASIITQPTTKIKHPASGREAARRAKCINTYLVSVDNQHCIYGSLSIFLRFFRISIGCRMHGVCTTPFTNRFLLSFTEKTQLAAAS